MATLIVPPRGIFIGEVHQYFLEGDFTKSAWTGSGADRLVLIPNGRSALMNLTGKILGGPSNIWGLRVDDWRARRSPCYPHADVELIPPDDPNLRLIATLEYPGWHEIKYEGMLLAKALWTTRNEHMLDWVDGNDALRTRISFLLQKATIFKRVD